MRIRHDKFKNHPHEIRLLEAFFYTNHCICCVDWMKFWKIFFILNIQYKYSAGIVNVGGFDKVHYPIHTYCRTIACLCDEFKRLSEPNRIEVNWTHHNSAHNNK